MRCCSAVGCVNGIRVDFTVQGDYNECKLCSHQSSSSVKRAVAKPYQSNGIRSTLPLAHSPPNRILCSKNILRPHRWMIRILWGLLWLHMRILSHRDIFNLTRMTPRMSRIFVGTLHLRRCTVALPRQRIIHVASLLH